MRSISTPRCSIDDESYHEECYNAIQPCVDELVAAAQKVGWDSRHVLMAIIAHALGDPVAGSGLSGRLGLDDE